MCLQEIVFTDVRQISSFRHSLFFTGNKKVKPI